MHEISTTVTLVFAGLLGLMVIVLALEEKIHAKKSLITGVAAVIALVMAMLLLPLHPHKGHMPFYLTYIEWEVVLIILGSSLFVDVVSKSGIFSYIAIKMTKWSQGDMVKLLSYYSVLTVVFSAVLNNVTAMIIIGSLSAVSLDKLNQKDKLFGFLIVEGLLTNVGGLLTLISSVPNIIVGQKAGISFAAFFITAAPYVIIATAVTIFMGKVIFKIKGIKGDKEKEAAQAKLLHFDENESVESRGFFYFSWVMFILLIVLFSTQSILPVLKDLGLGFVAMALAIVVMVRYKHEVDKNYRAIDWDLIFFFGFLFIIIGVMQEAGVLKMVGQGIAFLINLGGETGGSLGTAALLWASAFTSSVTDNIPLAAVLANILSSMPEPASLNLWWSVIFGANLGGNITPIGSASTVVAVTIIHRHKLPISFGGFVKIALPFALVQLALASGYALVFVE